jgi:sensor histidine kinase YesM
VLISVSDTGPGADALYKKRADESTGVGLANIRDRLSQAYGGGHRFETRQNERGGFSVIVEIPFETGDKAA